MKKMLLLSLIATAGFNPSASLSATKKAPQAPMPQVDPLRMAAIQGTEGQIRELVTKNAKFKDPQNMASALVIAIACRNVGGVRALLDLGANPNADVGPAGKNGDLWAVTQAMACFIQAATAVDIKQDGIALDQKSDGTVATKSVPKTDEQRTRELAEAQEIFEMVVTHAATDLRKQNSAGLNVYLQATIAQIALRGLDKAPKTVEAMRHVTALLESELAKRNIKPETLLKDAPAEVTRALKEMETQGKQVRARR